MQFFEELGKRVEQQWRDRNYDEVSFPEIAARALSEANAADSVDPWEITSRLHRGIGLPGQREDDFSDLPLTLYAGPRFRVDVYFWLDGTTSIHQHSFSGAFQVLLGSSIHSTYTFKQGQEVNAHFSVGQVLLEGVEVLEKGMVREILPGRQFIHSLFHLDRPSATVTVRTNQAPAALPQYNYLKPFFAFNPFYKEQFTLRRIQSVLMLLRMAHPRAGALINELVSSSDFQTTFLTLTAVYDHLAGGARRGAGDGESVGDEEWELFHALFKRAHQRHGEMVNLLPPVIKEMQRERCLIDLRSRVTEYDHRFFLALLLNVPHRKMILDLVGRRFPRRNPVETVCSWVSELSAMRNGASGLNMLGLAEFDENHLSLLGRLLEGRTFEQIREAEERRPSANGGGKVDPEGMSRSFQSLQGSVLLRSLLFEPLAAAGEIRSRPHAAS